MRLIINTGETCFSQKMTPEVINYLVSTAKYKLGDEKAIEVFNMINEAKENHFRSIKFRSYHMILHMLDEGFPKDLGVRGIALVETDFSEDEVEILSTASYPHDEGSERLVYNGDKIRVIDSIEGDNG